MLDDSRNHYLVQQPGYDALAERPAMFARALCGAGAMLDPEPGYLCPLIHKHPAQCQACEYKAFERHGVKR